MRTAEQIIEKEQMVSIPQIARLLGVSPVTAKRRTDAWRAAGLLAFGNGSGLRFRLSDIIKRRDAAMHN